MQSFLFSRIVKCAVISVIGLFHLNSIQLYDPKMFWLNLKSGKRRPEKDVYCQGEPSLLQSMAYFTEILGAPNKENWCNFGARCRDWWEGAPSIKRCTLYDWCFKVHHIHLYKEKHINQYSLYKVKLVIGIASGIANIINGKISNHIGQCILGCTMDIKSKLALNQWLV